MKLTNFYKSSRNFSTNECKINFYSIAFSIALELQQTVNSPEHGLSISDANGTLFPAPGHKNRFVTVKLISKVKKNKLKMLPCFWKFKTNQTV